HAGCRAPGAAQAVRASALVTLAGPLAAEASPGIAVSTDITASTGTASRIIASGSPRCSRSTAITRTIRRRTDTSPRPTGTTARALGRTTPMCRAAPRPGCPCRPREACSSRPHLGRSLLRAATAKNRLKGDKATPQEAEASDGAARASDVRSVVQVHSRLVKPPALLGPLSSMLRTAWQKWFVSRPRLNLPYECGAPDRSLLAIVPNGSQWRVVFGLSLRNDGRREARNWR